jgi:hypothetical protein
VRDGLQAEGVAEVGTVDQERLKSPIIELHRRLQHQAREELMLREFLGAVHVRISRQGTLGDLEGHSKNGHWRFAHRAHAFAIR